MVSLWPSCARSRGAARMASPAWRRSKRWEVDPSCLLLRDSAAGPVLFAAFDDRLNQAARAEGLQPPA